MEFSGPLRLAPGLRVVRRGPRHLQVGLHDGRRAVLPRSAAVETTLSALLANEPVPPGPATARVLATLERHGCLSDPVAEARQEGGRRSGRVVLHGGVATERALLAAAGV